MANTSVRQPYVFIQSPGGEVSAEGITFMASVNSAPTVEVILRRAKEDVVKPLSKDVLAAMGRIQKSRFELKDGSPDTTVYASDGNSGVIEFTGFAIAPVLEQSSVSSSETVNVVGIDAFLNSLGLSIYQSREEVLRPEETETLFKRTPSKATGDVAKMMQEVTDVLVSNLEPTLAKISVDSHKNLIRQKDKANAVGLKVWKDILQKSDVKFPETWAKLFTKHPKLGQAVVERVKAMLQQRTDSFWNILNGLGAEFLFFYRPEMDGSSGRLVRVDKKMRDDGAASLDVGVTRFSATDGNPSMLPLGGVIISGMAVPGLRKQEKPYAMNTPVGQWPVDIKPGYFKEMQAPAWLANGGVAFAAFAPKEVMTPKAPGADTGKKNLDPTNYKQSRTELEKTLEAATQELGTILQDFAHVMYEDMRLADSTATLEIPLDFTIKVGVRYKFSTGKDGGKFTGFVRALRHSLQLQNGTTLTSGTVLSLSHIIYE